MRILGAVVVVWWLDLQLPVQSVPIITREFERRSWRGVLDTTLCDKVCQRLDTRVSFINKADRHDITEILLKVALNTINQQKTHPA